MTFHIHGFSRNCSEAMIYGVIAMAAATTAEKMTGTFLTKYISTSERSRSCVFSFKLQYNAVR